MAKKAGASAVAGLPAYWDSPETAAKKNGRSSGTCLWLPAVNAKFSISVDKLLRNVTEQRPRNAALIDNLDESHQNES